MIRIVKRLDGFYWVYYTTNRVKQKDQWVNVIPLVFCIHLLMDVYALSILLCN